MYAKTIIFLQILHPLELEMITEQQRVQDARLFAMNRSFDNLQHISVTVNVQRSCPTTFLQNFG